MWSGEKPNSESFTAFNMEPLSSAGALHDNMLKVVEIADEVRLTELEVKSAGISGSGRVVI